MNDHGQAHGAEAEVQTDGDALPVANVAPRRRWSLAWLLVVLAFAFTAVVLVRSFFVHGPSISVQLEDGHGLKSGDKIRFRGILVGEVTEVTLNERGPGVIAYARLAPEASNVAVAGSRFWVVRPQVGLEGVAGIETIVGPRYLAVLPGEGLSQRHFVGLAEPPAVDAIHPDDLEITLFAQQRGSIRKGAPVLYRQVRVGTVMSAGLAGDGATVEARVHIQRAYRQLVRTQTRFWDSGGVDAEVRITGVSIRVPSFEGLLSGGVSFATPSEAGAAVRTGQRFTLASEPDDEWLEWEPAILVGSVHLPPGAPLPTPLRAKMAWREGRFWKSEEMRQGWVMLTERGLLGPADLFVPSSDANAGTVVLEVAGVPLPLSQAPLTSEAGLAILPAEVEGDVWPTNRMRRADELEECIAVADSSDAPLPLSTARLSVTNGGWGIDPALSVDASWHGAAVVARSDGKLIGVLLFDDDEDAARVALLPPGVMRTDG
jgi:paraquat-inducible protein B